VKLVLFTQRIDHINSRKETRDSNDQNYVKLLEKCGYLPVSIPNVLITPDNQNEFCVHSKERHCREKAVCYPGKNFARVVHGQYLNFQC